MWLGALNLVLVCAYSSVTSYLFPTSQQPPEVSLAVRHGHSNEQTSYNGVLQVRGGMTQLLVIHPCISNGATPYLCTVTIQGLFAIVILLS